jgi:hypothetical protein
VRRFILPDATPGQGGGSQKLAILREMVNSGDFGSGSRPVVTGNRAKFSACMSVSRFNQRPHRVGDHTSPGHSLIIDELDAKFGRHALAANTRVPHPGSDRLPAG